MKILSVVAIAAFVVAGLAGAADDKGLVAAGQAPAGSETDSKDMPVGTTAQVFGKIVSIHNCNIVGMPDAHVLAKLESAPGDVEIVDLGSAAELKSNGLEPHEGQQLWVEGRVGKINGKALVVAETLSESKLVTITRQAPLREETVKHADARQAGAVAGNEAKDAKDIKAPKVETVDAGQRFLSVEGNVVHTRHVKIEGESFEHILAKLQTENGIVVLDLGMCSTMPESVDLTAGKSVAASGLVGQLNGKPIIVAETVGNQSIIHRPAQPEVVPGKNISTENATSSLKN